MTGSGPRPPGTTVLAEVALLGVTLAAVAGIGRLVEGGSFLVPVALAAVLAHALTAALRRLGLGPVLATAVEVLALVAYLSWTRYLATTSRLLPGGATLDAMADDLAGAWDLFLEVSAPVPAAPGFVLAAVVGVWIVAVAADGLAFRLHATVEALAPATGLFLFASVLAEGRRTTGTAVLFCVTALWFALTARVARAEETGRWLATDRGRGARALLVTGAVLVAVAVPAAVLAAPRLPGGDGRALLDVDGGGDGDRVTLSPLVDLRSRLVEQSDVEVFQVRTSAPSYWRLTALDRFDGTLWSSSGTYVDVDRSLPSGPEPTAGQARVAQSFRIAALEQLWLPAAFEPAIVDSPDADVEWAADSSTLVVGGDRQTSDGLAYDVLSIVPRLSAEDLGSGTSGLDREFLARFTRLPATIRPVADRWATRATAGAADPYAQAVALQDWFRTRFTYSLDVAPGHDSDTLTAFLDPAGPRAGYCEQFAGSYAALARALGLPARVAVGFTPGDERPDDPGTFVVRGRHAHAWPEVYFSGVGWVAFEPTPGRGAPGAEAYTGVAAQQAPPEDRLTPATTVPGPAPTATAPPRAPRADDLFPTGATADGGGSGPALRRPVLLALVLGVLLWVIGVPLVAHARRRRRVRAARSDPAAAVDLAWSDTVGALALLDVVPRPAETPVEFAERAGTDLGEHRADHRALADLATTAGYGRRVDPDDAVTAARLAGPIVERAHRLAGPRRRLGAAVSPRRLR